MFLRIPSHLDAYDPYAAVQPDSIIFRRGQAVYLCQDKTQSLIAYISVCGVSDRKGKIIITTIFGFV